jgi:hypothetical protein
MALGDLTDADLGAMDAFSQRVMSLVQEVPAGALRRSVEPGCAGGLNECKDLVNADAAATKDLQQFITDVRYGLTAYALFVRDESAKYFLANEDAKRELLKGMRRDSGLQDIAPELRPVVQPK